MRGSPLIRTFLVFVALILSGVGLTLLANKKSPQSLPPPPRLETSSPAALPTPFILTLSAQAKSVQLESAGEILDLSPEQLTLTGTLPLETSNPTLFITVTWVDPTPAPRFAKLVLEAPSQPTLTRIFDASGEISDVWEIELHTTDDE